jgi:hypothetical protein
MAFPATTPTSPPQASSLLLNNAGNAGLTNTVPLDRLGMLEQTVGNLLTDLPSAINIPAAAGLAGGVGGANGGQFLVKRVTGIADNTATTVLTITVPNVAAAAVIQVTFVGIAGAGGAIGTCEDVTSVTYNFSVARTPGVAMGAKMSTAFGSAAAVVTGAGTMTTVSADPTLSGEGVTVTNTGLIKVTIDQSSTSTNHICVLYATVVNYLAGGVTIS